jgi:hypothetical protein
MQEVYNKLRALKCSIRLSRNDLNSILINSCNESIIFKKNFKIKQNEQQYYHTIYFPTAAVRKQVLADNYEVLLLII